MNKSLVYKYSEKIINAGHFINFHHFYLHNKGPSNIDGPFIHRYLNYDFNYKLIILPS